jgi:hypothetical protein
MLPPAFAETIPNIPGVREGRAVAVLCSNFACQPPISDPAQLGHAISRALVSEMSGETTTPYGNEKQRA